VKRGQRKKEKRKERTPGGNRREYTHKSSWIFREIKKGLNSCG